MSRQLLLSDLLRSIELSSPKIIQSFVVVDCPLRFGQKRKQLTRELSPVTHVATGVHT
jgi:hypothetical protein